MNESSIKKMKELGEKLREASRAYYQEDREIMSNVEYDALYDTAERTGERNRDRSGRQSNR